MHLSDFVKNRFGSKKGFAKYLLHLTCDKLLDQYKTHKKVPSGVQRIVFVCKGNVCRSAVAEWKFREISGLECCSIGLETTSGQAANARICAISKKYNIALDKHSTTSVKDFTARTGDLYVCMEPRHIQQLHNNIGRVPTVLLGEFGRPPRAYIHDPYNSNSQFAESCTLFIVDAVKALASHLPARLRNTH